MSDWVHLFYSYEIKAKKLPFWSWFIWLVWCQLHNLFEKTYSFLEDAISNQQKENNEINLGLSKIQSNYVLKSTHSWLCFIDLIT